MWRHVRSLILIGGAPCLGFIIGVILAFLFFPYDVESASNTVIICSGVGIFVGLFLVIQNIRRILKEYFKF